MGRKIIVGVMGGSSCTPEQAEAAYRAGKCIARAGAVLLCGGGTGVMTHAARGALEAGGTTLGILPGWSSENANEFIEIAIPTNLGDARNAINVLASDLVVAIGGAGGTLSEIALALKNGRTVHGFDTCRPRFSGNRAPEAFRESPDLPAFLEALTRALADL